MWVQELDKLTAEVMRYMLFKAYKAPNVPVKREELTHLISENYKQQRALPATVISNAQVGEVTLLGLVLDVWISGILSLDHMYS